MKIKKKDSTVLFHSDVEQPLHQTDTKTKRDVSTWPNSTAGHGAMISGELLMTLHVVYSGDV